MCVTHTLGYASLASLFTGAKGSKVALLWKNIYFFYLFLKDRVTLRTGVTAEGHVNKSIFCFGLTYLKRV